jgi:hypothetical protein
MHGPINVKSPNNISKWQMGFNSAFKGLKDAMYSTEVVHCRIILMWEVFWIEQNEKREVRVGSNDIPVLLSSSGDTM